ncbi:MAG TPA: CHASE2 domain-containing protein, partial [Candidatus Scatomorpha pullistercoris]|nr:CHASE2 domain-containing protein [Candidatus Scatomorpha pullistercoris]
MLKKRFTKALVALGGALVFTLAALLGLFYSPDQVLADALYQKPKALDGNIFVIGIDDRAMDDIGPYQTWGRDVMAMAIEALNADPENRPAAIGIDVLYTGET